MLNDGLDKLYKGARDAVGLVSNTASDAVQEVRDLAVESATQIRDAAEQAAHDVRSTLPSLEEVLAQTVLVPGVSIDRQEFLADALKGFPRRIVDDAIAASPARAGVPPKKLRRIAGKYLGREARRTTVASAAAGLPGGVAAAATIPADLIQLYAHLIRAIQMLSYLYGWRDACHVGAAGMDPATGKLLVVFLGAMAGDERADAELGRLAPLRNADGVLAAVAPGTVDVIAQGLEARMAQRMTGQVVGKSIPLAGAIISGTISYGGFSDMWKHLRDVLEKLV